MYNDALLADSLGPPLGVCVCLSVHNLIFFLSLLFLRLRMGANFSASNGVCMYVPPCTYDTIRANKHRRIDYPTWLVYRRG